MEEEESKKLLLDVNAFRSCRYCVFDEING